MRCNNRSGEVERTWPCQKQRLPLVQQFVVSKHKEQELHHERPEELEDSKVDFLQTVVVPHLILQQPPAPAL
jgi:hypothetical protein